MLLNLLPETIVRASAVVEQAGHGAHGQEVQVVDWFDDDFLLFFGQGRVEEAEQRIALLRQVGLARSLVTVVQ